METTGRRNGKPPPTRKAGPGIDISEFVFTARPVVDIPVVLSPFMGDHSNMVLIEPWDAHSQDRSKQSVPKIDPRN